MKNNKREFEVGDKVKLNYDGFNFLELAYEQEDIEFLKETVYGIVVEVDQNYPDHAIVNWVNHKGMITQYEWYIRKEYIDLYQDVPRET